MKKIVFFIGSISNPRGAERVTAIIANGLVGLGYNVEILSIYNGKSSFYFLDERIKLTELFEKKINIKKNYFRITKGLRIFLKLQKIDILVDVDILLSLFSFIARIGLKTKVVSWEHFNFNTDAGSKNRVIARKIAMVFSDKILTLTEEDSLEYKKRLINKNKVLTIENPASFINKEQNLLLEEKIISVGRLNYQKGYDLLIKDWKVLVEKHPTWKLEIAGDGEQKFELENQIKEFGLENNVKLLGNIEKIEKLYKTASIYVMSSRFEGLPMTLIEAKSFGIPIVSFDCKTGPKEILRNNYDGYLIENGNSKLLVSKVIELIENPIKRKEFGTNAYLDDRYKIENIIEKWCDLIKNL